MKTLLSYLSLVVLIPASQAQVYPLSENSWSDPGFRERFLGTYGMQTDLHPSVDATELELIEQIGPLVENNPREAIRLLERGVDQETSAALDFTLGNLYYQENNMDQAIRYYRIAIEKFSNYYKAYLNLGRAYVNQGAFAEALPFLQKAIELKSGDGTLFGLLAYCYLNLGRYATALDAYNLAVMLQPTSRDWRLGKLETLNLMERYSEGMPLLFEFIAEDYDNAYYWQLMAQFAQRNGDFELMAVTLEMMRLLDLVKPQLLAQLGDYYAGEGLAHLTVEVYEKAIGAGGFEFQRVFRSARFMLFDGKYEEADSMFQLIEERLGADLTADQRQDLRVAQADLERARGDESAAVVLLEAVVAEDPVHGPALLSLSDYYRSQDDTVRALHYAELASKLEEHEHAALLKVGQVKVDQKDYVGAARALRRAQDLKYMDNVASFLAQVERLARRT